MKKVLVSLITVCLLFSGFVTVKSLTRDNLTLDSSLEALSAGENGVYFQTMGYCTDVITWKCTLAPTSELCRRYVCKTEF